LTQVAGLRMGQSYHVTAPLSSTSVQPGSQKAAVASAAAAAFTSGRTEIE
jgi:hypothetical protein